MPIDFHQDDTPNKIPTRHSALEEFTRDERRPALLLLGMLLIAAIFFALGIMIGRWTATSGDASRRITNQSDQPSVTPAIKTTP